MLKSRVSVVKNKDGSAQVVVQDPHTGRVVSEHRTSRQGAEQDARTIKESLERKGHSTEVTEH